jgi:uncharacterized protein YigA (DUF484 family)
MFMAANREPADNLPIVIDYLESNPNFFLDKQILLSKFNLPHITGRNISSMIEYQVDHFRKNEQRQKKKIEELIKHQEHNDRLAEEAYKLTFELGEMTSIEALYDKLFLFLKQEFQCSHCLIFLFVESRPHQDYRSLRFKPIHSKLRYFFSGLYNVNKPLCDSLPAEYIDAMFAEDSHKIKSTVSLPINNNDALGLFILGSPKYNAYQQGFTINLLNHLKNVFVKQSKTLLGS